MRRFVSMVTAAAVAAVTIFVAVPAGAAAPEARSTAPACSFDGGFEDGFADVTSSNTHEASVDCIVYWQVTTGMRPGVYAPAGTVTRGQMASFLARFIEESGGSLPANPPDAFPDDDGTTHEANIDKLAAAEIAGGRADGTYAPNGAVFRNQMASFIVRTLEYRFGAPVEDGVGADYFTDDDGDTAHEDNIDKAAALGITGGTSDTTYGPQLRVRRDQMASFLARSLAELVDTGHAEIPAPPPRCALDDGIERTDSQCRPCPTDPSIAMSDPGCRTWTGAPPLGDPALRQTPNAPQVWDNSDPSVLVDGRRVYLFGSTNNMRVPVREVDTTFQQSLQESKADWDRSPTNAMPQLPAWVDGGEADIWAPTVEKIGTRYVMYFAARHAGATTDEANDQCIGRATSSSPMGPYAAEAQPVYCGLPAEGAGNGLPASNSFGRGALDPEVFRAPDGALYLLVAITRTEDNIGVLRLGADGSVQGGINTTPTILQRVAYPWHDGTDDGARFGGFLENPSMVFERQTGTYLLFYSAGTWYTENYNTGFARCATPMGPCTPDSRGPFLKSGASRTGPGGLTAFTAPDGSLRAVYATWQAGQERPESNPGGIYSRQSHWARIVATATNDPAGQRISLG